MHAEEQPAEQHAANQADGPGVHRIARRQHDRNQIEKVGEDLQRRRHARILMNMESAAQPTT